MLVSRKKIEPQQAGGRRLKTVWMSALWMGIGCMAAAVPAASLFAQQTRSAGELYGQGVQAYFNGSTSTAEMYLTQAIERDPSDPRAYYFRGLSRLRMGDRQDGQADFARGAAVEAADPGRHAIGSSLERVQGTNRLMLERYRSDARAQRLAGDRPARQGSVAADTPPVLQRTLRQNLEVPLDQLLSSSEPSDFLDMVQEAQPAVTQAAASAASPVEQAGDPFLDDPPEAGGSAAGIPTIPEGDQVEPGRLMGVLGRALLSTSPVPPSAIEGAMGADGPDMAAGSSGDDFFGPPTQSAGDPFGSDAAPAGSGDAADPSDDPFGGSDPFGSDNFDFSAAEPQQPAAGSEAAPAEAAPAEIGPNPFGGAAAAPSEAGGNPFGGGTTPPPSGDANEGDADNPFSGDDVFDF